MEANDAPRTPPLRDLALLAAAGAILRLWGMSASDFASPQGVPLDDDSFYYFTLGRNLSLGHGPRIGSVLTNGFQPIWGALSGAAFALARSDAGAIRLLQSAGAAFGIAAGVLGWILIWRLTRSRGLAALGAAAYLLSPSAVQSDLNAMETAAAVVGVVSSLLLLVCWAGQDRARSPYALGLCLGAAFLTRVDALVLWVGVTAAVAWASAPEARVRRVVALAGTALCVTLPWVAFSTAIGKPVIPESGQAVRQLTLLDLRPPLGPLSGLVHQPLAYGRRYAIEMVFFLSSWATHTLPGSTLLRVAYAIEPIHLGPLVAAFALALFVVYACARGWRSGSRALQALTLAFVVYAAGVLVGYGAITLGPWGFPRYSVPVGYASWLLFVAGIGVPAVGVRAIGRARHEPRVRGLVVALALALMLDFAAGLVGLQAWMVRRNPPSAASTTVRWMDANLDPLAPIGAFQSGYLGFVWGGSVENLDGKVDREAREALGQRATGSLICARHLRYFVDWATLATLVEPARLLTPIHSEPVSGMGLDLVVYRIESEACPGA